MAQGNGSGAKQEKEFVQKKFNKSKGANQDLGM